MPVLSEANGSDEVLWNDCEQEALVIKVNPDENNPNLTSLKIYFNNCCYLKCKF